MKTRSAKNKGVRLQNSVRDKLIQKECWKDLSAIRTGNLTKEDVRPAIMGQSGIDINLSYKGRSFFPFSIECKNVEKLNIWKAFEQAESNCYEDTIPAVIHSKNRSKILITMEFDKFLEII